MGRCHGQAGLEKGIRGEARTWDFDITCSAEL